MRLSGLATGLDTDTMVKEMMKPYQIKVDRVKQDKISIKYKQELYRDILKESQDFYNKYFSVSSKDSIMSSSNWKTVSFKSGNEGVVTASGSAGANISNYSVAVESSATEATTIIKTDELFKSNGGELNSGSIKVAGKWIDISGSKNSKEVASKINEVLKKEGIDVRAEYSEFSDGLVIKTNKIGKDQVLDVEYAGKKSSVNGTDALVRIKNARGEEHVYKGSSNSVTLDGVTFNFTGVSNFDEVTEADGNIKKEYKFTSLTGQSDTSKTKDLIVNMVNDYNKLIENINKQLLTKHDRSYAPLTDEQRKDMSEEQQKLWDKKAKEGLLRGDMHLRKLADNMKSIMRTAFDGFNLEDIGIVPVQNYGEQNGMFTIDESKLEQALEKNADRVKDLFLRESKSDDDLSSGGIIVKMKDLLYKETVSVSSSLMKKAGMEGSVTAFNNELTESMKKQDKIIAEMEKDLAEKENNFYLQFSRLETQMSKLNSQSAYLMSQLGGGM